MEIKKRLNPKFSKPRSHCRLSDGFVDNRPEFIVIHYTACPGATAEQVADSMKKRGDVSTHYIVDGEKVLQCVEDNCVAWHCGGAKSSNKCAACNQNAIGVDMVENKLDHSTRKAEDQDWYFSQSTIDNAVELVVDLMERYEIPPERVVRHYDITGKYCPRPFVGDDINKFYGVSGDEMWRAFKRAIVDKMCLDAAEVLRSR